MKKIRKLLKELGKEFDCILTSPKPQPVLFDHLPKCGGTTLNDYLRLHYPRRRIFKTKGKDPFSSVEQFKSFSKKKRYRYDLVQGHLVHHLINDVKPDCLVVTILRSPVERIISHYYYAKSSPDHYLYNEILAHNISLDDYATSEISVETQNWYVKHFSGLSSSEVNLNPDVSLDKAISFLSTHYDIIGLLDEFDDFTKTLQQKANYKNDYSGSKFRVSLDRPLTNDIPLSIRKRIEDANQLDIALYNHVKHQAAIGN